MNKDYQELLSKRTKIENLLRFEENKAEKLKEDFETQEQLLRNIRDSISLAKKCVEENLENKTYIEDIVSKALTSVFGYDLQFKYEIVKDSDDSIKGLKPLLREEQGEWLDPLTGFGAGSIDMATVCIRIAVLILTKETNNLIILDEPVSHASKNLVPLFKAFIQKLTEDIDLQMIIVTHTSETFGKTYKVTKTKGISSLKELQHES